LNSFEDEQFEEQKQTFQEKFTSLESESIKWEREKQKIQAQLVSFDN
jgi:hypothetical protein